MNDWFQHYCLTPIKMSRGYRLRFLRCVFQWEVGKKHGTFAQAILEQLCVVFALDCRFRISNKHLRQGLSPSCKILVQPSTRRHAPEPSPRSKCVLQLIMAQLPAMLQLTQLWTVLGGLTPAAPVGPAGVRADAQGNLAGFCRVNKRFVLQPMAVALQVVLMKAGNRRNVRLLVVADSNTS